MSRNLASLSFAASLIASTAVADAPRVVVDIAPLHSLVARVMDGVAAPTLIVTSGATPHEYSLRPSQAAALQNADVVFWTSHDLTPWLDDAVDTLASDAQVLALMDSTDTVKLSMRESALFETHQHEDKGHDDHADHSHDAHDHDDHDHEAHEKHADQDDHAHGEYDPHAWLSPDNGAVWLDAIAGTLAAADPGNANTYQANAKAGRDELAALRTEINGILDPARGGRFIVFHDAYQYFETAFDIPASGAISISDAADPSPARIAEIQARVADQNVTCVLSEPQFDPGIVAAVMEGSDARTGVLDPLGSDLKPGSTLYPNLLRNLATALADCL